MLVMMTLTDIQNLLFHNQTNLLPKIQEDLSTKIFLLKKIYIEKRLKFGDQPKPSLSNKERRKIRTSGSALFQQLIVEISAF